MWFFVQELAGDRLHLYPGCGWAEGAPPTDRRLLQVSGRGVHQHHQGSTSHSEGAAKNEKNVRIGEETSMSSLNIKTQTGL